MPTRKRLSGHLAERYETLLLVVAELEAAKRALTACVPSSRIRGRPLAEGIADFEERLRGIAAAMHSWHCPEVEPAWAAAADGVARSLRRAERLRTLAPDLGGFDGLIAAIDAMLAPLEAFEGGVPAFRRLRT